MRPIDADRLLEERRIQKYYHLPNGDIAIPIIDIEHAPTVELGKGWIPCSERLPEDGQVVLVQDTDGSIWIWKYFGENLEYRGPYQWKDENDWWLHINEVDAWMPLPEPWKGEEE